MDMKDVITRAVKYLVEGIAVALALLLIPRKGLPADELVSIVVVAAAVFAILDIFSPTIGVTARQGAGFGLGANLVGFPRM
jgi:hypothetical protein